MQAMAPPSYTPAQKYALECVQQHLPTGCFPVWNSERKSVELKEVSYLERLWRHLLAWTGLCSTTAQRCALYCKQTFETIGALAPAQPLSHFGASLENNSPLRAICYKLWQSALVQWLDASAAAGPLHPQLHTLLVRATHEIQEHGYALNADDTRECLRRLNVGVSAAAASNTTESRAVVGLQSPSSRLLELDHVEIPYERLADLLVALRSTPSERVRLKEVTILMNSMSWPCAEIDELYERGLHPVPATVDELRIETLRAGDELKLANCLRANPMLQLLQFPTLEKAQPLSISLVEAIESLARPEWIDFGSFMWPVDKTRLPIGLMKLANVHERTRSLPRSLPRPDNVEWEDLLHADFYLGSRVYFGCPGDDSNSFSLPLGFVSRLSARVLKSDKTAVSSAVEGPLNQSSATGKPDMGGSMSHGVRKLSCENLQELETLKWLFLIAHKEIVITGLEPQPSIKELLLCAQRWQMRSIIEKIIYHQPSYWMHPQLLSSMDLLDKSVDQYADFYLELAHQEPAEGYVLSREEPLAIDRYLLAIYAPHRAATLMSYDSRMVYVMTDSRIQRKHLEQYYQPKPIALDEDNFEAFWALAIQLGDESLKIQACLYFSHTIWTKFQERSWHQLNVPDRFLIERCYYLALSCDLHLSQHILSGYPELDSSFALPQASSV